MPSMDPTRLLVQGVAGQSEVRFARLREELIQLRERQARAVAAAVSELSEFARSDRAPRELRAAQQRVDRGELTWERIVLGGGEILRGLLGDRLSGLPHGLAEARALVADGMTPERAVAGLRPAEPLRAAQVARPAEATGRVDVDHR
jgi:hypothetical protein